MSTIAVAKHLMGWLSANYRPACCRCYHVEERSSGYPPVWHCKSGGFLTNANAVCNRFQPFTPTPTPIPTPTPTTGAL